jgi:two-component system cell cycle response regulator DivK
MPPKPSILVVDDSCDSREMLIEYLLFRGFEVTEARNGSEAIDVARRVHPQIILMDLSMPIMDGWQATRQLKADPLTQGITIICVTAHAFRPEQRLALAAGCDVVVAKPYDLTALANALERVMSEGVAAFDSDRLETLPNAVAESNDTQSSRNKSDKPPKAQRATKP